MREEAPVRYDPERRTWDVFRYEDVKHVLDDDEMFSVDPQEAADFVEPEGPGEGLILDTMLFEDPPRHDELRGRRRRMVPTPDARRSRTPLPGLGGRVA